MSRPSARPKPSLPAGLDIAPGIFASILVSPEKRPTRRISGPASARQASPMSNLSRSPRLLAEMYSPHTLRRGNELFSTIATAHPRRASDSAADVPAGPPPMTIASWVDGRLMAHLRPAAQLRRRRHGRKDRRAAPRAACRRRRSRGRKARCRGSRRVRSERRHAW